MALTTNERDYLRYELGLLEAAIAAIPADVPAPAPPPAPAPDSWQPIAAESADFVLDRRAVVRFGVGTQWAEATLESGTHSCNPWGVWGDPAPGVQKTCQIWTGAAPAPTPVPAPPAPTPPPPAPTPPAPAPSGQRGALYFAPTGNNSNAGTLASPKRDLVGLNVSALPPTDLLFQRGGVYTFNSTTRLTNRNYTAASPLVFNAYGTGAKPELQFSITGGAPGFEWGGWQDGQTYTGYEFRNLKLNGMGVTTWGIWLRNACNAFVVDKCEVTGFSIGIHISDHPGAQGIRITNSRIVRNSDMGILGKFDNSVLENNYIAENNFGGSGFSHGSYLSGAVNAIIRNNWYYHNSAPNGVATGGNCTFHGEFDGLLIEGNKVEQVASEAQAWQMSITAGYTSPEWFRNLVARGNWFINSGNCAMNAQACPGALIEQNVIVNTQGTRLTGVSVGMQDAGGGDDVVTGAVSRNNRGYATNGSIIEFVMAPGAGTMSGNTVTQGLPTEQYVGFDAALLD